MLARGAGLTVIGRLTVPVEPAAETATETRYLPGAAKECRTNGENDARARPSVAVVAVAPSPNRQAKRLSGGSASGHPGGVKSKAGLSHVIVVRGGSAAARNDGVNVPVRASRSPP